MPLVATHRAPLLLHAHNLEVGRPVGLLLSRTTWYLRHDLPPKKTSQIRRVGSGQVAVGHQDVDVSVAIDIGDLHMAGFPQINPGAKGPIPRTRQDDALDAVIIVEGLSGFLLKRYYKKMKLT